MKLPTIMLAISPQATCGLSWNSSGPGVMLNMISAPISTAVVPVPGIPSVSSGIIAPPAAPLFAASGAATPWMAPLPKFAPFLLIFFSVM